MDHKIIVAGIGPGEGTTSFQRLFRLSSMPIIWWVDGGPCPIMQRTARKHIPLPGSFLLAEWLEKAIQKEDVVVMVSGDPGFYSLLPWLKKKFPSAPVEVIPGISSVQAAFCLIGEAWQGGSWLSLPWQDS